VILFELLTGKNPYYEEPGIRVSDLRQGISLGLETLLDRMLKENISQRPWNGKRLKDELEVFLHPVEAFETKMTHTSISILEAGPHTQKNPMDEISENRNSIVEFIDNLETPLEEKNEFTDQNHDKVSLRSYILEIENLINKGQIDQAIGHCKHILQIFPKHIDSYRLLGKALLEKQKYGDASDIFQRVLSSVTDDFISHIAMSVICEYENKLDAAIWHLERAFEVQPTNKSVQDELLRLYSNRDGIAPPKIRLTSGALARMYIRGELYNQAIAEIYTALSEDPNRVDLEVILAQSNFLQGRYNETVEICSKIITKLPYCYEVNRILSIIIKDSSNSENYKVYRQRIIEMDPYNNYLTDNTFSSTDVPDGAVMIAYLR